LVKVDRVEWLYIPEAVTAAQALGAGEIDYWENVPSDYAPALARDAEITIRSNAGNLGTLRFNHLNPPFSDIRMRQAVLMVADQRDYLSAMAGDPKNWRTCFSFYTCDGAEPDEQGGEALSGPRDVDKAKRLIGEAGYNGGLTGAAPGWPTDEKIEALRAAWFAATEEARRRDLAAQIRQRAFEFVPHIPTGQLVGRRAFPKNLAGVLDAPIPFLWNIEKQPWPRGAGQSVGREPSQPCHGLLDHHVV